MDKAELILFGVASFLAIKSLVSLMGEHRQHYKRKLADELTAARRAAPPAPPVAPPPAAPPTARPTAVPAGQRIAAAANPQSATAKTTAKSEPPAKKAG
jgi:hypothetical protein